MKTGWLDVDGEFEVIGERGREATIIAIIELRKEGVNYVWYKSNNKRKECL